MGKGSKPGSVRDGHLSRPHEWARSRRRLRDGSRLPASASNLKTADSEIAAGRIALFTPAVCTTGFGLCCSHTGEPVRQSGLSTLARFPGFHQAPLLCAARTFLWPQTRGPATILPALILICQRTRSDPGHPIRVGNSGAQRWCRRGDLNSHEVTLTTP